MTQATQDNLLKLWYDALEQENGLAIEVDPDDYETIRTELYRARRESEDPRLEPLSLAGRANGNQIWIWRKPEATLDD